MTYLKDQNEQIVAQAFTNADGITFEPFAMDGVVGFRIVEVATERVEYLVLAPSGGHEYNEDNGATADTFVYTIAGDEALALDADIQNHGHAVVADYYTSAVFINHFERGNHDVSDDEEE